jgi:hypothetical protein
MENKAPFFEMPENLDGVHQGGYKTKMKVPHPTNEAAKKCPGLEETMKGIDRE